MPNLKVRLSEELETILNKKKDVLGMNKSEFVKHVILKTSITQKVNNEHSLEILHSVNKSLKKLTELNAELREIKTMNQDIFRAEIKLLNQLLSQALNAS